MKAAAANDLPCQNECSIKRRWRQIQAGGTRGYRASRRISIMNHAAIHFTWIAA
jgi:hypothetical protein